MSLKTSEATSARAPSPTWCWRKASGIRQRHKEAEAQGHLWGGAREGPGAGPRGRPSGPHGQDLELHSKGQESTEGFLR